jgi:hypothetical protein
VSCRTVIYAKWTGRMPPTACLVGLLLFPWMASYGAMHCLFASFEILLQHLHDFKAPRTGLTNPHTD